MAKIDVNLPDLNFLIAVLDSGRYYCEVCNDESCVVCQENRRFTTLFEEQLPIAIEESFVTV